MDFETSTEVASCVNRLGYEKEGQRAVELLRAHGIQTTLSYIKVEKDGPYTTDNGREATRWVIYVNTNQANNARKLLRDAVKNGLVSIVVSKKSGD